MGRIVESQLEAQSLATGVPREHVLEDVLLAPQAVKRLLEPEEVAEVAAFLPWWPCRHRLAARDGARLDGALSRLLATVFVVLSLGACGGDDDVDVTPATTESPTVSHFTLYYLDGEHLRAFPATSPGGPTPAEAVEALLANEEGHPTEIPPASRLNGVAVVDRLATVDLSRAFESGGGSASMQARVAQVVYTLTQWSFVGRVTFELDGEPVEAIGGEGVPARELTRTDFEGVLPPIFVDPPLTWASSPLGVAGSASVFEANVSLRLEANGETLAEGFATAAEGAPGRGAFEAMLDFDVDEPTNATLIAFEVSAADGSETNVVRVPVRLCPPSNLPC